MSKRKTFEVIQLAAYYEKIFSDDQIKMYAADLEDLSDEETVLACKLYRADPENQFFPRPMSKLVSLIKKPISNEDLSSQISALLIKAVIDYGQGWDSGTYQTYNIGNGDEFGATFQGILNGKKHFFLQWDHAAISVFGFEGLAVVNRYGGWLRFCEVVNASPDGVIRQQSGKLATSLLNTNDKIGSFSIPLINQDTKSNVLDFKNVIKEIEK